MVIGDTGYGRHRLVVHPGDDRGTLIRLHRIGLGRRVAGTSVTLLANDMPIRVLDRHTGERIRELTLDATRDFHPRRTKSGIPTWQNRGAQTWPATCSCYGHMP